MNVLDFKDVRRPWTRSPYPAYHTGDYLEEAMYKYFCNNRAKFKEIDYTLIPIFWTTAYLDGINVQRYVSSLPRDRRYFAVSQHDDAIKEKLPDDTVVFSAGGNSGGIPIPLVCSPICTEKDKGPVQIEWLASFVGSDTHPIRRDIVHLYEDNPDFKIITKPWSFNVNRSDQYNFTEVTKRSIYTLCPRGYGAQSFRTYEAMQLGSIPVYIHDDNVWLPYNDIVPWDTFSVLVHQKDLPDLEKILTSISINQCFDMKKVGEDMIKNYFNIDSVCENVYAHLKSNYENHRSY